MEPSKSDKFPMTSFISRSHPADQLGGCPNQPGHDDRKATTTGASIATRLLAAGLSVALLVTGAAIVAVAVAVMLWNDLGPGPLDVLIGAIRSTTGIPLAFAVWSTIGTLTLMAWVLGRRPGVGTIAAPLLVGPIMQVAFELLEGNPSPDGIALQVGVQVAAIAAVGGGSALIIVSGLGAGTNELLTSAASDRSRQPEPRVRLVLEVSWVGLGVLLGGPIGVGTILFATLIGSAVEKGVRSADAMVARGETRPRGRAAAPDHASSTATGPTGRPSRRTGDEAPTNRPLN